MRSRLRSGLRGSNTECSVDAIARRCPCTDDSVFRQLLTHQLAKRLVDDGYGSWTKEAKLQEAMSALLASCDRRGLKTIRIIVTRKLRKKVVHALAVDKIAKTRRLQ